MVVADLVALVGCGAEARTTMKMGLKMTDDTQGVKANSATTRSTQPRHMGCLLIVLGCSGVSKLEGTNPPFSGQRVQSVGSLVLQHIYLHIQPHPGCSKILKY
jgi:hypothetical protein